MTAKRDLVELLAPTATTAERTRGLMILLAPAVLAGAVGVKISSLRNWASGQSQPRPEAALVLDDLRAAARVLLEGGVDPERASAWLTSRDPDSWDGLRPVEAVRLDPMDVLASAHGVVLELEKLKETAKGARAKTIRRERALALVSDGE